MTKRRRHFGSVITRPDRPGFYIRVRRRGRERVRYSGRSKTVANTQLAKIEILLATGLPLEEAFTQVFGAPREECPPFRRVAERYMAQVANRKRESTVREDRSRLNRILRSPWARRRMNEIRPADIARWLDRLGGAGTRGKPMSPATLNRYRSLVSVIFNYAVELGFLGTNPVRGLKRHDERGRERREFLALEELQALLEHCGPELRLIVLAAATTGLRRGTLLRLRWRDVDLDHGTITVDASIAKGKRPLVMPVGKIMMTALKTARTGMRVRQLHGDDPVFCGPKGRAWNPNALWGQFRKAVDNCDGIPQEKRKKIVFHSLRHTFASLLTMGGIHQRVVQQAMSHSVPQLTARYSHLAVDALHQVADYFDGALGPGSPDSVHEGYQRGYQAGLGR